MPIVRNAALALLLSSATATRRAPGAARPTPRITFSCARPERFLRHGRDAWREDALRAGMSRSAEGDRGSPAHAKRTGGASGQVDAPSLHERTTIIYPDGDASPGRVRSDCDLRAERPGAMRRGHRVWIHPLARCSSATAIAIVRSNTGFGERRRRQAGERQGGTYRADHRFPLGGRGSTANLSRASRFPQKSQK